MKRPAKKSLAAAAASAALIVGGTGVASSPSSTDERCGAILGGRSYMTTREWTTTPSATKSVRKLGALILEHVHYNCVTKNEYVESKRDNDTLRLDLTSGTGNRHVSASVTVAEENGLIRPETVSAFALAVPSGANTLRVQANANEVGWTLVSNTTTPEGTTTSIKGHTTDPDSGVPFSVLAHNAFSALQNATNSD